ncbi:glycosyltransferase family 4 protein [Parabacteroides sp. BX2]|jgi:glycosyltransferase involved in cell wall biosynthesis|uniref:Glycosyltransferase family 4 protein n=1 Tax=Parabacteroides segnis TaxID=2763058 RepID=A0ABR7EBF1_9BACT|nr:MULTISPECIES: glycosyltransferase family 4 protein [Parabacteroides]MBC5646513.1 glycosyltransferase family 4 protein [Parabacteroides segnis]MCM0716146.1 glycosyltransferase family 4 protein [Parabacteroides sp. TA-V-105]
MKILFLTDNFPPEVNAPATRSYEHCKEWVQRGIDVTIITCFPNFPQGKIYKGYKNKLYQSEFIDGIHVIRVWTYITANEGFIKRTLDYISFSVSGFIAGLFQKTDIIIATSPQFFTALSGRTLSFWKRKPWIMEVRDLWPESIKTVGAMNENILIRYFEWQEKRCYHSAKKIVVVTDSFKRRLVERGIDSSKIEVVKNGVNRSLFVPVVKDLQLLNELGLQNKKIIGYIGTHGMAHKLDFILQCAKGMEGRSNYHFLFLGSGAEKRNLLDLKEKLDLKNVTMLDPVSKLEVKRYISILDIALINLRKSELFTTVIPSKIFENAGMEIPILMGVNGEAREIIESYHAGVCFEPESETEFCEKLDLLLTDENLYNECKEGCKKLSLDFDRNLLANKMLQIITQINSGK